jgi:hypothetical protein
VSAPWPSHPDIEPQRGVIPTVQCDRRLGCPDRPHRPHECQTINYHGKAIRVRCEGIEPDPGDYPCPPWCTVERHRIGERGGLQLVHVARSGHLEITLSEDPYRPRDSTRPLRMTLVAGLIVDVAGPDDLDALARNADRLAKHLRASLAEVER